jgi:PTS system nitrogen regulatory IIA component
VADDDFDIPALAVFLQMMPAQVLRLAERGHLPGRRVSGAWRFSKPEVNQWLEARIGLADDRELASMESSLQRTDAEAGVIVLGDHLSVESVATPLRAKTRASVISDMVDLAAASGMLWDAVRLADAITAREDLASTALDSGAALLHPRRPLPSILGQAVLALGIASQGIPFGGAAGRLTDVFFLIAATSDHEYLRILARVSRMIGDADWLEELRSAASPAEARRLVLDRDVQLGV